MGRGIVGLFKDPKLTIEAARNLNGRLIDEKDVLRIGVKGYSSGVLFEDDISVNPRKLFDGLRRILSDRGVEFKRCENSRLVVSGATTISYAMADLERVSGEIYVVASGAWTKDICRPLGYNPQILPARGLVMLIQTGGARIVENAVFLEDYGIDMVQNDIDTFRMSSFFELVGFRSGFDDSRKKWLFRTATEHLIAADKLKSSEVETGVGFRPCTPDQIPVIGKMPGYENAYVASGNCRLGMTLAPVTGLMIRSLIHGDPWMVP
jgi:D-amino-acid dehydrogenase